MGRKVLFSLILMLGIFTAGLFGASYSYQETFDNQVYRDPDSTTGEWGTASTGYATPGLGPREVQFTSASVGAVTKDVAENGRYILCAASNLSGSGGGIYIFDGEGYDQVASLVTGRNHQAIAVSGKFAYLVDNNGEVTEVNISNLSSLSSGTHSVGAGVNLVDAAYSNGYLYSAAETGGIYITKVDAGIGSATSSNYTGYTGSANARGVHIWGRYLLVADNAGLFVLSLQNPASPSVVGSIITISNCYDIDTDGYFAFVASGDKINIVDLSDPTSPAFVTFQNSLGNCTSIAFNAGFVVGCYGADGAKVFDFRDYLNFRYSGKVILSQVGATAEGAVTLGKQTVVANGNGGGVVFISNAHVFSPAAVWKYENSLSTYGTEVVDVITNGRYAYVTLQTYGLVTIDLTTFGVVNIDPIAATSVLGMQIAGDRLLISAGTSGLLIFDITDPDDPSSDGAVSIGGGTVYSSVTDGKYAYLAVGGVTSGIARVDLYTRAFTRIETEYDIFNVALKGNYLAAACRDYGLGLVDITEFGAGTPEITDFYAHTSGRCWGMVLDNDYAYLAYGDGGLVIVDLATMSYVGGLARSEVGIVLGVTRFDSLVVLVRDETNPLVFVDVTNPASPAVVSTSILPAGTSLPEAITQWQDYMLIADYYGGIKALEIYTEKNALQQSQYMSSAFNSVTDITYFLWKSLEYFPEGGAPGYTDNKDTLTVWMLFNDGTMSDDIKIFRIGEPGANYYQYPEPLPWGGDSAWEYIGYLPDGIQELKWKAVLQNAHDGWTLNGAWHADSVGIRYLTDAYPPGARRRVSVRIDVDFGGGEITELEIGLDSTASDRFDPGLDELYYPTGPGPHAYFAIDDPDMPEGVGLSACWVNSNKIGRPVRLVLTEPAVVSWTAPTELDPGSIILADIDMTESSSIPLSEGDHKAIPGASSAVYFRSRLERGWNMVSPIAYPLVGSPREIFGVSAENIWSYNDAMGGFYNPTEVGDGLGYFVLSTSEVDNSFYGLIDEWTCTKLHTGWNLIGGPTAGAVHISDIVTRPTGLIWPGPFYTLGDGDYDATEWLTPGRGHWVFSLGEGELFAREDSRADKPLALGEPELSATIRLAGPANSTALKIGVDSRELLFNRLLTPALPGKRNIGGLIATGAPTYLSTSVLRSAGEWELVVFENCRISSDVEIKLTRGELELSVDCFGIDIPAGRYKLTLEGAPVPKDFILSVSPNPFNSVAKVTAVIPSAGKMSVSVYDLAGRKVSTIAEGEMSAGRHTYSWNALDFEGKDLPSGVYFAKLSLDGATVISKKLVLLK